FFHRIPHRRDCPDRSQQEKHHQKYRPATCLLVQPPSHPRAKAGQRDHLKTDRHVAAHSAQFTAKFHRAKLSRSHLETSTNFTPVRTPETSSLSRARSRLRCFRGER